MKAEALHSKQIAKIVETFEQTIVLSDSKQTFAAILMRGDQDNRKGSWVIVGTMIGDRWGDLSR